MGPPAVSERSLIILGAVLGWSWGVLVEGPNEVCSHRPRGLRRYFWKRREERRQRKNKKNHKKKKNVLGMIVGRLARF